MADINNEDIHDFDMESSASEFSSESDSEAYKPHTSSSDSDTDFQSDSSPTKQIIGKLSYVRISSPSKDINDELTEINSQYFSKRTKTSSNTLSMLNTPKVDLNNISQSLKSFTPQKHGKKGVEFMKRTNLLFEKWLLFLNEGFNILLYGIGSKKKTLQKFKCGYLSDCFALEINGYIPSIAIKELLSTICEEYLEHMGTFPSVGAQCDYIVNNAPLQAYPLFLIVHNLDGKAFRNDKCLSIMCSLASCPSIYFLASVDHVASSLLWNQERLRLFNFVYVDSTNYNYYAAETFYNKGALGKEHLDLQLSSILHVYESLTPNAQKIFTLLVNYQLSNCKSEGMLFSHLYDECRQAFLVVSDLALRTQLTEFKDHHLIKQKNTERGETLTIPLPKETLQEFVKGI